MKLYDELRYVGKKFTRLWILDLREAGEDGVSLALDHRVYDGLYGPHRSVVRLLFPVAGRVAHKEAVDVGQEVGSVHGLQPGWKTSDNFRDTLHD